MDKPAEKADKRIPVTQTARQALHDLQHAGESYSATILRLAKELDRDPDAREGGAQ